MNWNKFKYLYFALFLIFLFSGLFSFYLMLNSGSGEKPQIPAAQDPTESDNFIIDKDTEVIFEEQFEVCQNYNLNCSKFISELSTAEREKINGLTLEELKKLYPSDRWQIEKNKDTIVLIKILEGLCPDHKQIFHLGVNNSGNFLTVYYGPGKVKDEGGIYKITEIPIKHLPEEYQQKVRNGQIEFYSEEELIATLDSFSEFL